jgi:propanol-preferring alcohol dehydrogenase
MKAVILSGNREVRVEERATPKPGPGEVLVRTRASAICRSDMSLYVGNPIVGGERAGTGSVIPGHEAAGVVADVGPGVTGLAPGDRVAAYLALGCGRCEHCRTGYLMLCPQWSCFGFDVDGGDADYFVLPERNLLNLPDNVSYVAGALLTDMLGSQYHVQKTLGVRGGKSVAVIGLGPMGAAAVVIAKAFGAQVFAVDLLPARLSMATGLGADVALDPGSTDVVAAVRDATGGRGVDVAIDCSGSPAGQNTALDVAAKRGAVSFVGESRATEINPSDQIIRKLLTVVGGWYFPIGDWDEIVRLVVKNDLPVEAIVSHRYPITAAEEAFRAFDQRETEKAVFTWTD